MPLKAARVLSDGSAVVSTRGLRRIADENGRVIVEFACASRARELVESYNSCFPNGESWAEAITYREAARREAAEKSSSNKEHAKSRVRKLRIAKVA